MGFVRQKQAAIEALHKAALQVVIVEGQIPLQRRAHQWTSTHRHQQSAIWVRLTVNLLQGTQVKAIFGGPCEAKV